MLEAIIIESEVTKDIDHNNAYEMTMVLHKSRDDWPKTFKY